MKVLLENLRVLVAVVLVLAMVFAGGNVAQADTLTADVTVTATPSFIGISVNVTSWGAGTVTTSSYTNTTTGYFGIDNTSSVITNNSISVTGATWTGGTAWTHSDTATIGADTVALRSNKGGTWGTSDVIVKNASPNNIAASQAANTDWPFGLSLQAPTSFSDGTLKTNTVRITASAA